MKSNGGRKRIWSPKWKNMLIMSILMQWRKPMMKMKFIMIWERIITQIIMISTRTRLTNTMTMHLDLIFSMKLRVLNIDDNVTA